VSAVREFFYYIEAHKSDETAYDKFAQHHVSHLDTLITFNYDVSLERALKRAGMWDIGSGLRIPAVREQTKVAFDAVQAPWKRQLVSSSHAKGPTTADVSP
jgi:hypothetical protein